MRTILRGTAAAALVLAIGAGMGWTVSGYIGAATALLGLALFAWAWQVQRSESGAVPAEQPAR